MSETERNPPSPDLEVMRKALGRALSFTSGPHRDGARVTIDFNDCDDAHAAHAVLVDFRRAALASVQGEEGVRTNTNLRTDNAISTMGQGKVRDAAEESEDQLLAWLEQRVRQSPTGVSFDYIPAVDGEPSGFRFTSFHHIGEPHKSISAAVKAEGFEERPPIALGEKSNVTCSISEPNPPSPLPAGHDVVEALRPFAAIAEHYAPQEDDSFEVLADFDVLGPKLTLGMFRKAAAALSSLQSLRAAPAPEGWQPIETAPKDGTLIEVRGEKGPYGLTEWRGCARWGIPINWHRDDATWIETDENGAVLRLAGFIPTHWRHLAAAPSHGAPRCK